ncbi:MAG: chloride channel protein [Polyangiaceae bacterium]|nr:chloride channel protein [Polyangiaceae bacterium]
MKRLARDPGLQTLVAAVLVGAGGGVGAVAFRMLIRATSSVLSWILQREIPVRVALVAMIPALGGLLVGLMGRLLREASQAGGIRGSMAAATGLVRPPRALLTGLACAVSTGSGGSAGCEGPLALASSGLGTWMAQRLGLPQNRLHVLGACGVSAAIAGLFHAPIAGVVFAIEIVLGGYAIQSLAPLVASAATSAAIVRLAFNDRAVFDAAVFRLASGPELIAHAALGIACGAIGALFVHALVQSQRLWGKLPIAPWSRPALGGLLVGLIAVAMPQVLGVGYPVVGDVLSERFGLLVVMALLVAKGLATSLTLGSGGAGDVIAPSLLLGACSGSLLGAAVHRMWPETTASTGAYAAIGMTAMLAAVAHAPVTGVVLLFELTDRYSAVLSGAVACILATVVSSMIRNGSAYATHAAQRGLLARTSGHVVSLSPAGIASLLVVGRDPVGDVLDARVLLSRLPHVRDRALIVAESATGRAVGVLGVAETLDRARTDPPKPGSRVRDLMNAVPNLQPTDSLPHALVAFMSHRAPAMPVVDDIGLPLGLLLREDLMEACAHELLRDYLHLGRSGLPPMVATDADTQPWPLCHDVSALPVPPPFVGKTLRDLGLGHRFGVVCIGLRRATPIGAFAAEPADPALVLRQDDVLIVTGEVPKLERMHRVARGEDVD